MKVNIQQNGNEVIVTLQGEFDTVATNRINDMLNRITDLASLHLIIDCKELEYISSSGLRFFMQLKKNSEQHNGTVTLCNLNKDVEEIFRLSGFHHIFKLD